MDLPNVQTYLRPADLESVKDWQQGWAWLSGGTWLFSQAQPNITTLVDLEKFGWSEIEVKPEGLAIGAACIQNQLLEFSFPEHWQGIKALESAVSQLASFKVSHVATVGGNICLALPVSTFAPVMIALGATYEIWHGGFAYRVRALEFQTGVQQTILQPGEVLRKIWIPASNLEWQTSFQRICVASDGYALSTVVAAFNSQSNQVRFGLGACVSTPRLVEFTCIPTAEEIADVLDEQLPLDDFVEDDRGSASYRRQITQVLMERSLFELCHP
jgi:CO/xanthine dehydrogenase FAD-binding subunit